MPEAKKRNRYLEPEAAREIIAQLPPFVTTVGVCVNAAGELIEELLAIVDCLQLCGDETPELCRSLGARAYKAFRVHPEFSPDDMLAYATPAYLLDAYVQGSHGGTGKTCDWDIAARAVALGKPVILAGGLTPENVADAVRTVRPYAVDTAGGVESAPGKKDHDRIREFIKNAKLPLS